MFYEDRLKSAGTYILNKLNIETGYKGGSEFCAHEQDCSVVAEGCSGVLF